MRGGQSIVVLILILTGERERESFKRRDARKPYLSAVLLAQEQEQEQGGE